MRIKSSMKKIFAILVSSLLLTGLAVQASDLIIESKNQSYNEADNKIKFNGNVKVTVDDLKERINYCLSPFIYYIHLYLP